MFRAAFLLTTLGLVTCQEEQSSLLQTASRDTALTKRAHNVLHAEDEDALDDAMEGKQCTTWLADEAVANAHDELEAFRTEMKELGYEAQIKNHVKIGAYCPAMLADSALTFLDTPCEDRQTALEECIKGLSETCKFEKKALKKMMEKVKKFIKQEWEKMKRTINEFPKEFRPELPNLNFDHLFARTKEVLETHAFDCDEYKKLKMTELEESFFTNLKDQFSAQITLLRDLQTEQIGDFTSLVNQAEDLQEDAVKQANRAAQQAAAAAQPPPPVVTFNGHVMSDHAANAVINDINQGLAADPTTDQQLSTHPTDSPPPGTFTVNENGTMTPR